VTQDLSSVAADSGRIIMLGGYAAKRCPVRTHNDFAPLVPVPELEPSAELQADFDGGIAFEAEVFTELLGIHRAAVLIDPGMRAYTIKVNEVAGGGGHVLPGDRVDVLLARALAAPRPGCSWLVVMQQRLQRLRQCPDW
jgi:hypothetical protein